MEKRNDSAIAHTARGNSSSNRDPSGAPSSSNNISNTPLTHRPRKPEGEKQTKLNAVAKGREIHRHTRAGLKRNIKSWKR